DLRDQSPQAAPALHECSKQLEAVGRCRPTAFRHVFLRVVTSRRGPSRRLPWKPHALPASAPWKRESEIKPPPLDGKSTTTALLPAVLLPPSGQPGWRIFLAELSFQWPASGSMPCAGRR